jgi:hypothetical protein
MTSGRPRRAGAGNNDQIAIRTDVGGVLATKTPNTRDLDSSELAGSARR